MNPRLIHSNENTYYTICLIFSIVVYVLLCISLLGIFYLLIGLAVTCILHGLMLGHIKNNGIKLTERQFPHIHAKVQELCQKMEITPVPDVYVLQSDGMLNAFATRFFGRNFVVLYSNLFELSDTEQDELAYVIAHELAHIKRKHMTKQLLILPALWMPFLGKAYSRACEFTCDRIAAAYTGNAQAAIHGLTILAIGRALYKEVNIADYIYEASKEAGGFFTTLSRLISTHPPLPQRIYQIEQMQSEPERYGYYTSQFEQDLSV